VRTTYLRLCRSRTQGGDLRRPGGVAPGWLRSAGCLLGFHHTDGLRADPAPPIFAAGRRGGSPVMDTALDEKKEPRPSRAYCRPQRLFGDPGCLLRIVTTGLAALSGENLSAYRVGSRCWSVCCQVVLVGIPDGLGAVAGAGFGEDPADPEVPSVTWRDVSVRRCLLIVVLGPDAADRPSDVAPPGRSAPRWLGRSTALFSRTP